MTRTLRRSPRPDDVWASRRRHPTARPVPPPRRSGTFVALAGVLAALNLIGMVMVLSASSVAALDTYGSTWYVALRQAMWLLAGTGCCILVMRVDYYRWRRLAVPALGLSCFLLVLVLVPG